ncbi:MAG TPA: thioesterase family protein [Thermoanaerobaculia bacterium]|nr:thioesterase family protein [Thermoanaerobaculia bacterium]
MTAPAPAVSGWRDGWYVVPYQVTWRDLDAMGHVNNAVYFSFFEWARTKYWMELAGSDSPHDLAFIVARAECDFRKQLGMMNEIELCVRIDAMRGSSFDFVYEVRSAEGIAATGKVVVVYFSWKEGRKMTIPDDLRRKIEDFQKS